MSFILLVIAMLHVYSFFYEVLLYIGYGPVEPFTGRDNPRHRSKDKNSHDQYHRVICQGVVKAVQWVDIKQRSLIPLAEGFAPPGNRSRIIMKITQDTATVPIGRYHLPRLKGPGLSLLRPDVIRRKMGVA